VQYRPEDLATHFYLRFSRSKDFFVREHNDEFGESPNF